MAGPAGIEPVTPGSPRRAKSLTRASDDGSTGALPLQDPVKDLAELRARYLARPR